MERHSRFLPAAEWRRLGFQAVGAPWPADTVEMSLVEPDGPGTAAYLTTRNYRAIMAYNCSNFYALSVALLGDALAAPR
jgi:membrane-bound lytic murein transglycosylase B